MPPPVTLTEKLRLEWPVMLVVVAGVWYLGSTLSTINERLAAIETQLMGLPTVHSQLAAQGERISRLEALTK